MKKQVIILVADDNYISHAKSLMVNCREQGKYDGDFAVICPKDSNASSEFRGYGLNVLDVEQLGFMQKFHVFDSYFKQWEQALYLDCDIIIQDDLSRLFSLLSNGDLWMDTEDGNVIDMFWQDPNKEANKSLYDWMELTYPHINDQTLNTAVILFNTHNIEEGLTQQLIDLQTTINPINNPQWGGTDQQTINVLLNNKINKISNRLTAYWGFAEPINNIANERRRYVGGETPVLIHYSRWYAQWIHKKPTEDAYIVRHLGISSYELYHKNLLKFEDYKNNTN